MQVQDFNYLGSLLTEDVEYNTEIWKCIGIKLVLLQNVKKALGNEKMSLDNRDVVLHTNSYNTIDGTCEHRGSIKENADKKYFVLSIRYCCSF